MDLSYGPEYEMFREEVRGFIAANRHLAPTNAGRAARPSKEGVAWPKLLIPHGCTARPIPREYAGSGAYHRKTQYPHTPLRFSRARGAGQCDRRWGRQACGSQGKK